MALKIDRDDTTNNVLHGCLVSWLSIAAVTFLIFFTLSSLDADPSADVEKAIQLALWLLGIAIGGYVAARRSKNDGNRVALYVGLLATIFVVARLPHPEKKNFADGLFTVLKDPAANWRHIVGLTFTVPAALLGGLIAQRRRSRAVQDQTP